MQPKIFVSYRTSDVREITRRVSDAFAYKYGKENVFFDEKSILGGADWKETIINEVEKCDCLIVIIGEKWLEILKEKSNSHEIDYVVMEINLALSRGKHVIPLMINQTIEPSADNLPETIRSMVNGQIKRIYTNEYFDDGIEKIFASIEYHIVENNLNNRVRLDESSADFLIGDLENESQDFGSNISDIVLKHLSEARDYLNKERFLLAVISYTIVIEHSPNIASAFFGRGLCLRMLQEFEKSIKDYTKAIELEPAYFEAYNNRGETYHHIMQIDLSIADYKKTISINPNSRTPYYNLGLVYKDLEEWDKSIEYFNGAIATERWHVHSYRHRGLVYEKKHDWDMAIKDFSTAIQIDVYDWRAYAHRGFVSSEIGNYKDALIDYERAIEIVERFSDEVIDLHLLYCNKAHVHTNLKEYDKSLQAYNNAIQIKPTFSDAYTSRGSVQAQLKFTEKAILDYSIGIALNPLDEIAHNNRGWEYMQGNQLDLAKEDFENAIKLNPDFQVAKENLQILATLTENRK